MKLFPAVLPMFVLMNNMRLVSPPYPLGKEEVVYFVHVIILRNKSGRKHRPQC